MRAVEPRRGSSSRSTARVLPSSSCPRTKRERVAAARIGDRDARVARARRCRPECPGRPRTGRPARAGTALRCRRDRTRTGRPTSAARRSCPRAPFRRAGSRSLPARAAAARRRRRRSSPRPAARSGAAAAWTRWSYSTTSAAARHCRPRTVMRPGIARAGADQVDDARRRHRVCRSRRRVRRRLQRACASARISPAPSARSCAPTRAPSARGVRRGPLARLAHGAAAVERDDDRNQLERVAVDRRRERADRRLAAAAERFDERALRLSAAPAVRIVDRAPRRAARASSSSRISIATMPWPGAGTQAAAGSVIEIRDANPSRRSPAAASTMASWAPSSSLRRRVSRLPRIGANRAPGNSRVELRDAPHAAGADRRRLRRGAPRASVDRVDVGCAGAEPAPARAARPRRAGLSRGSTPAIVRPSGSTAGMSLLLWTARSMSPPEQRVLDFLDEEPLAADLRERRVLQAIARRLDDDDAARRAAGGGDPRRDGVGLPQRELAAARAESEFLSGSAGMAHSSARHAAEVRAREAFHISAMRIEISAAEFNDRTAAAPACRALESGHRDGTAVRANLSICPSAPCIDIHHTAGRHQRAHVLQPESLRPECPAPAE